MLKQIWKAIPSLVLALLVMVVYSFLTGLTTIRMMNLFDYALAGELEALQEAVVPLLVLAAVLMPIGLLKTYTSNQYKRTAAVSFRRFYIKGIFHKNIAEFQQENNAEYLSRLTNDCNLLDNNFTAGIYTIFDGLANFFVGMWIVSAVNPWMILLAFAVALVNMLISAITNKPVSKGYKERSDMFDGFTSYIKEVLSAFHIVTSNNLQDKVTNDYNQKSEAIQKKYFTIERMTTFVNALQSFVGNTSIYVVFVYLGYLAVKGEITAAQLLLVISGLQQIARPLFQVAEAFPKLFSTKATAEKMNKSLKNADNHIETEVLPEFHDKIELKNVGFAYKTGEEEENRVLDDVSLTLKKNGKYLIVGPSGGGKSTLLRLLRKYFAPTAGNIYIDGHLLYDITKESYYSLLANIEQQVFIFEDTLENNLTLYKEYTDEELEKAIEAAGLKEFVANLPDGLNTMLYDNGRNVSGGERSRIVIARALLSKASILFMDEAFASLDMERAKEIEQTILGLQNMTVINVSHVLFEDSKSKYDAVLTVKRQGVRISQA